MKNPADRYIIKRVSIEKFVVYKQVLFLKSILEDFHMLPSVYNSYMYFKWQNILREICNEYEIDLLDLDSVIYICPKLDEEKNQKD